MRAIIADRDSESLETARSALHELHVDVDEVGDGDRFVDVVLAARPDLVVADLETVTATQLGEVRGRLPSLNLLVTYADRVDLDAHLGEMLVVGSTDFLARPFDRTMFLHRVRTLASIAPFLPINGVASAPPPSLLLGLHHVESGRLDAGRIAQFMGVSLKTLAEGLGRNYRAVHKTPDAVSLQADLQPLRRCLELLLEMVGTKEAALAWLNTPSADLSGETPIGLITTGHTQAVWALLEQVATGAPT